MSPHYTNSLELNSVRGFTLCCQSRFDNPIIAAHFVQHVVSIYEKHHVELALPSLSQEEDAPDRGKECSNLIVLLSELYNFQVISSVLMFDLIRDVLKGEMSEFSVELLLKVLRSAFLFASTDHFNQPNIAIRLGAAAQD